MRKVALAEIGTRGGFVASNRFGAASIAPANRDPVAEAFQAGLEEGRRIARCEVDEERAQSANANRAIELAFARFDEQSARLLEDRLRKTVAAICQSMAGEIAVDAEGLAIRVQKAAAMLRRKHDERVVRLHPSDLALVKGRVNPDLRIEPDPLLQPGQLRVEGDEGGLEDGAQQWNMALAEALGTCSG